MTVLEEPKLGHVEFGPGRSRGHGSPFERMILVVESVLASMHSHHGEPELERAERRSSVEVEEDVVARLYGRRTGTVERLRPHDAND